MAAAHNSMYSIISTDDQQQQRIV